MPVYRLLNFPHNYPDTNMMAGNCRAKFNWGQLPRFGICLDRTVLLVGTNIMPKIVANELRVRPQCMKKREFDHLAGSFGGTVPHPPDDRICFGLGRDLYRRPKNRPTIDKVIVRNPGCTLLFRHSVIFRPGYSLLATHCMSERTCI